MNEETITVALAGNPNVGKSTLFNTLTGMRQHTGNWVGKTVETAKGSVKIGNSVVELVDLPGTYSLFARSDEEQCASDYLLSGKVSWVMVVCDAGCLERGVRLVLQTLEITNKVIVVVNMVQEAKKRGIQLDLDALSKRLGVQVVAVDARKKSDAKRLLTYIDDSFVSMPYKMQYPHGIEEALSSISPESHNRYIGLQSLFSIVKGEYDNLEALKLLNRYGYDRYDILRRIITTTICISARNICESIVSLSSSSEKGYRPDKFVLHPWIGNLLMVAGLAMVLFITVYGANVPSMWLAECFSNLQTLLIELFQRMHIPSNIISLLLDGGFHTATWVLSVMVPPMLIFFPLFTLLEDCGYLPRVAFLLDHHFSRADSCGKQALTMCMGLGCNVVGVSGSRIIESAREKRIAVLTNSFMPCNGRFPTLIAIITVFAGSCIGKLGGVLILVLLITVSVAVTFLASGLLSRTVLRGNATPFMLELPVYRKPKIGQIIVRSIFDRTAKIAFRALAVSAPAGMLIWLVARININGVSLLTILINGLNPIGSFLGLDGVVLLAFIMALPANETLIPAMLLGYTASGVLSDVSSYEQLLFVLRSAGWTAETVICFLVLVLFHSPCTTTLFTIKKELGSIKWTILSIVLPSGIGVVLCAAVHGIFSLIR